MSEHRASRSSSIPAESSVFIVVKQSSCHNKSRAKPYTYRVSTQYTRLPQSVVATLFGHMFLVVCVIVMNKCIRASCYRRQRRVLAVLSLALCGSGYYTLPIPSMYIFQYLFCRMHALNTQFRSSKGVVWSVVGAFKFGCVCVCFVERIVRKAPVTRQGNFIYMSSVLNVLYSG